MDNPYLPPLADAARTPIRGWLKTVLAALAGFFSLVILLGNVGNCIVLSQLQLWPTAFGQRAGIVAMLGVMFATSLGFGLVSIGLFCSQSKLWKRGFWILIGSVLGYAAMIATAVATSSISVEDGL